MLWVAGNVFVVLQLEHLRGGTAEHGSQSTFKSSNMNGPLLSRSVWLSAEAGPVAKGVQQSLHKKNVSNHKGLRRYKSGG